MSDKYIINKVQLQTILMLVCRMTLGQAKSATDTAVELLEEYKEGKP